ncbi:MAG: 2-isopropylmalate synthase [Oscillospiraceae bacterium]|nr:2-isopropylmalate synthase [Oscillospiraceae bacterium]
MSEQNNRIIVFDTTLRDGEQTPGVNLNISEKLDIARHLEQMGVDVIEAGFPAASIGDFKAVRAVSKAANCTVAALCRCVTDDIRKGWEALKFAKKPRIHVFIATSEIHMKYKLKMAVEDVFNRAVESVRFAAGLCGDVEFSCEDASRSDPAFLHRIVEAVIDAGASTVNIADTVGYAVPDEFAELIRGIRYNVPNIDKAVLSIHCHDDLGLAVSNTLAALMNGARQIETTVNGIGERAGNCSMEEVVMVLSTRSALLNLTHGIDTKRITRTSQRVSKLTGVPVSEYKSVIGANAFTHESGIHQHGVLKNPLTYEIMTPESVGKSERSVVLGKLSGRHAFISRLGILGFELSKEEVDEAFERFKTLADRKKNITDDDLEALMNHKIAEVPERFKLDSFQVLSGNKIQAMAAITIKTVDGKMTAESSTGDGPIDAAYNAVARIVGGEWPLASYDIKAVTEGEDALGEVTIRIKKDNKLYTGRGLATDVIEASILAYVNAINRVFAEQEKEKT